MGIAMPPGNGHWEEFPITIYGTITLTCSSVTGIAVGQSVTIAGNTTYNGAGFIVTAVDSVAKTVKIAYNDQPVISGTGGTVSITAPTLLRTDNVVTASTSTAHGLNPGDMLTVSGVANTVLGTGITAASRVQNIITITTSAANGIRVGSKVIVAGVTDSTFNGTWDVTSVISATQFQYTSSNLVDASSSSGTVSGQWNNTQRFVIATPTAQTLTYAETGPDAQTIGSGTITPVGQVNGGLRNGVCMFQTQDGFITPPCYPIRVTMSGNKKMVLTDMPIGPSNVVARIFAFTGVDGGNYFYIPVPARNNGNPISTSTVVNDNTSTSAIFDFSDSTLLSATAIDIDGNNLFALKILGNCSGVAHYADRMFFWGDENRAINFTNMGFEGGINSDGTPMGWQLESGSNFLIHSGGVFGDTLNMGLAAGGGNTPTFSQPASLDFYGNQIIEPNTQYTFKCWAKAGGIGSASILATLWDTGTNSAIAIAVVPVTTTGGFFQADFDVKTPNVIPVGLQLRITASGTGGMIKVDVDEMSVIYTERPFNDQIFSVSYVTNPESVDGVTGVLGASADPSPIMDTGRLRDNFYFVTENRLHTTKDQESSEPSGWSVNEVSSEAGSCTMQSMIEGKNWLSWVGIDGALMFDGSLPIKITQDIQTKWDAINDQALKSIWAVNDNNMKRIYWGVPIGQTDTNRIYYMDYRFAETAGDIEDRGAIRVSPYTGKMLVIELSRKVSPWTIPATCGGMFATAVGIVPVLSDNLGRSYRLDVTKLHDDDYGTIPGYYVTSPFVSGEMEQQLQLGNNRHLYSFLSQFIYGTGKITITPLADALDNAWPVRGPYTMTQDPQHMMEVSLNVAAERCFFKYSATPIPGSLDAWFSLSRMNVTMQPHPWSPIRAAQ